MRIVAAILAICAGASLGALLRWRLSEGLNPVWGAVPLGTLIANLLGGLLVGIAIRLLPTSYAIGPELRLLVITGFLGSLTTFSTLSLEVVTRFEQRRYVEALLVAGVHLAGSLLLTSIGVHLAANIGRKD